jgi:hypothetical protein
MDHRACTVSGVLRSTYSAFVELTGSRFLECEQSLTIPEFSAELDRLLQDEPFRVA